MVTLAHAAPSAQVEKNAPKSKKNAPKETRLDRLNVRVRYLAGLAAKLVGELDGQDARLEEGSKAKPLVLATVEKVKGVATSMDEVGKLLFRLRETKWEPSSGARSFRAGDVVTLKVTRQERFTKHGAYLVADLRNMKVVSVHGTNAKIASPKGEALGLVPLSWLVVGEKPAEKPAAATK